MKDIEAKEVTEELIKSEFTMARLLAVSRVLGIAFLVIGLGCIFNVYWIFVVFPAFLLLPHPACFDYVLFKFKHFPDFEKASVHRKEFEFNFRWQSLFGYALFLFFTFVLFFIGKAVFPVEIRLKSTESFYQTVSYFFLPLIFQLFSHLYNCHISQYKIRKITIGREACTISRWKKNSAPLELKYSEITREFVNDDIEFYTKDRHLPICFIGDNTIKPDDIKLLHELLDDRFEQYE